jgi:hypothetical protein
VFPRWPGETVRPPERPGPLALGRLLERGAAAEAELANA